MKLCEDGQRIATPRGFARGQRLDVGLDERDRRWIVSGHQVEPQLVEDLLVGHFLQSDVLLADDAS